MNTLTEAAPARPARAAAALPESRPVSSARPSTRAVRALGAGAAILVAAHLTLAIVFVPRWPEGHALLDWSAIGVPVAMILVTAAMWLTRAAAAPLLALQYGTAVAAAIVTTVGAVSGDPFFVEDLDMWTMITALTAQYIAALGVLARGAWRGLLRVLPILGASWAAVVLPVVIATEGTEAAWWIFIVYVCSGLILNGAAIAVRPPAREESAR